MRRDGPDVEKPAREALKDNGGSVVGARVAVWVTEEAGTAKQRLLSTI